MSAAIEAIVLAAGGSSRFGKENKLLVKIEGVPVVRKVVSLFTASPMGLPVTVVTGHENTRVEAALEGLPVHCLHNPHWKKGMGSSLSAGAAGLSGRSLSGVLVCLGDLPYLTVADIGAVLEAFYKSDRQQIVVPEFSNRRGHPVLFPAACLTELQALSGDRGARDLIRGQRVRSAKARTPGIYRDIDSPDDF